MPVVIEHEQGHFDISKLFALKLEEKFKAYRLNISTVEFDVQKFYDQIIEERTKMNDLYDKIEAENPMTDIPQKQFIENIKKQIITFLTNSG
jgi:predicted secreted Zn-dependent protease